MIEMHIVANLVTLGVIGALAYIGWSNGLFFSVLLLLRMVISIVLTMICFEELAMLLEKVSVPHPWAIFSAFAGLFLVALFLSTAILDAALKEKQFHTFEMIAQAGGAVGGASAGLVFMGGVLVAWTMCPLPTQYRLDPGSVASDAGKLAIQAVPGFSKRVVLESPARAEQETHASETATEIEFFGSEPFMDANGNGQWDEGESFVDIDRSGGFNKILVVNARIRIQTNSFYRFFRRRCHLPHKPRLRKIRNLRKRQLPELQSMVAEPELPATTAQSQVAASGFPDRKENRNAAQAAIDAGE